MVHLISRFPLMVLAASIVSEGCDSAPESEDVAPGGFSNRDNSWESPPAGLEPQRLAEVYAPFGIAVDGTTVYVSRAGLAPLLAVPTQGGSAAEVGVLASGSALAVDEGRLYWSDGRSVFACEKSNCADSTVNLAANGATGMAIHTGHVYWSTRDSMKDAPAGQVIKADKNRGKPADIAFGNAPHDVAVDTEYVYWIEQEGPGFGVVKTPIAGGLSVQLVVTDPIEPMGIALDANNVYFMTGDGKVLKVSKSGGPTTLLLGDIGWFPRGLATDGVNVYVGSDGGLLRVSVSGGRATWLLPAVLSGAASAIALDDTSVYVADRGRNAIVKVAK